MAELKYWQAVNTALAEELERDPTVVVLGEDVARAGGPFGSTRGLFQKFGDRRVWDTPISELALMGIGTGSSMTGLRPVVEIMYMDFMPIALDQLVNQAAKMRFMSGGRYAVPLTVLTMVAARTQSGPQHSQSFEAMLGHIPGIRVVWPSTPADAKGLLKTAIRSDDPVVFMESLALWRSKGDVPDGDWTVPIGKARVHRTGRDVTLVGAGAAVAVAAEAAEALAADGIDAEVIDLRSISPLDEEAIVTSVAKTGRLIAVQDNPEPYGVGRMVVSAVAVRDPSLLRKPAKVVCPPFAANPFCPQLEQLYFPTAARLVEAARSMLAS